MSEGLTDKFWGISSGTAEAPRSAPQGSGITKRVYAGGIPTKTNTGFTGGGTYSRSMDAEIRYQLRGLRSHSRVLYQNNDYYKKFIRLVIKNVVGPSGFNFKNGAKNSNGRAKK